MHPEAVPVGGGNAGHMRPVGDARPAEVLQRIERRPAKDLAILRLVQHGGAAFARKIRMLEIGRLIAHAETDALAREAKIVCRRRVDDIQPPRRKIFHRLPVRFRRTGERRRRRQPRQYQRRKAPLRFSVDSLPSMLLHHSLSFALWLRHEIRPSCQPFGSVLRIYERTGKPD